MKIYPNIPDEVIPEGMGRVEYLALLLKAKRTIKPPSHGRKTSMKDRRESYQNYINTRAIELMQQDASTDPPPETPE